MKRTIVAFILNLLTFFILFLVTVYFGSKFLNEKKMGEGDMASHFHEVMVAYDNFPRVPLWDPANGGGTSVQGVNWGASWLTAGYSKIFNIEPQITIKLFLFLSPLFTSMGIY